MARETGHAVRTSQEPRTAWLSRKGCACEDSFGNEHSTLCTLHTDLWFSPGLGEERVEPLRLVKVSHFRFRELVLGEPPGAQGRGAWLALRSRKQDPKD